MRRWLPWAVLAAVVAGALFIGAGGGNDEKTVDERVADIAATVRCPTCRSQSVRDSDAPAAGYIRSEIERRVVAGESDDEIREYLLGRYGQTILLTPPRSGVAGLVWVLPVAGLLAALAALAFAFRRWRAEAVEVTAEERTLVERARRQQAGGTGA